jgi:DNA uptake protein ComE-like DNA-binding protein
MPGMPPAPGTRGVPGIPGMPMPAGRTLGVVDLNTASLAQLQTLPGMTDDYARKILAGRPFHSRAELERGASPKTCSTP